jgi:hypothetical protein
MRARVVAGCVFGLALAWTGPAYAQITMGYGVIAGVNVSTLSGNAGEGVSKNMRTGGTFGGFVSFLLSESLSFEPQILYSMEGVNLSATNEEGTVEPELKIDMVRIPVLLRFGPVGTTGGYFIAGPSIGILTRAKFSVPGEPDQDLKDGLKKADAALLVGGGFTTARFLIEARYTIGITDLNRVQGGEVNSSRVLSILVGGRF